MGLIAASEPWAQTAEQAACRANYRGGYAARSELKLRNAMELALRERRPDARLVHELVMGAGKVRADICAIDPAYMVAVEVKGDSDTSERLLHQVAMFQLCVSEVWIVLSEHNHSKVLDDARLIRHLLPSIGLMVAKGLQPRWADRPVGEPITIEVEAEPAPRSPVPRLMLEMLWRDELASACGRTRVLQPKASTARAPMIAALEAVLTPDELQAEVCTELRAREALWRADDPIGAAKGWRGR